MDYCFQCMAKLEKENGICPVCGHDNSVNANGVGFLPPCTLNRQYVIGRALGRGGFGITYLGFDVYLARKIAVKEYYPMDIAVRDHDGMKIYPADPNMEAEFYHGIERVLREARVAASLETIPNVVKTYGVLLENGTVYIVMEYIDGMTLTQFVRNAGGKLSWLQAWPLLMPVMVALGHIHSKGIVHRDVSPDNIMIRKDGSPVLLDFGTARNVSNGKTAHSVTLRMGYAPLEQFSTSIPQDGRTDQYAMMATLYFALTGKEPPSALDMQAGVYPRSVGADIPEASEKVLIKGMSRNIQDRYPDMESLVEAFKEAASSEYTRIVPEHNSVPGKKDEKSEDTHREKSPLKNRRKSIVIGSAGAAIIIGAAALVGVFFPACGPAGRKPVQRGFGHSRPAHASAHQMERGRKALADEGQGGIRFAHDGPGTGKILE